MRLFKIYLRAEFRRRVCDGALDIRVQPKFKEKGRTPDIFLIYILKRNIFVKLGARIAQSIVTGLRTGWHGIRIPVAIFLSYPKFSDRLWGASGL
jgi:hypothetical protein